MDYLKRVFDVSNILLIRVLELLILAVQFAVRFIYRKSSKIRNTIWRIRNYRRLRIERQRQMRESERHIREQARRFRQEFEEQLVNDYSNMFGSLVYYRGDRPMPNVRVPLNLDSLQGQWTSEEISLALLQRQYEEINTRIRRITNYAELAGLIHERNALAEQIKKVKKEKEMALNTEAQKKVKKVKPSKENPLGLTPAMQALQAAVSQYADSVPSTVKEEIQRQVRALKNKYRSNSKDQLDYKVKQFGNSGDWGVKQSERYSRKLFEGKKPAKDGNTGKYVSVEIECILPSKNEESRMAQLIRREGLSSVVTIKEDGSINNNIYTNGKTVEIVLTVVKGEWEPIVQLGQILKTVRAKVNASCGLHVHFDFRQTNGNYSEMEQKAKKIARVVPALKEMLPNSRRENKYCKTDMNSPHTDDRYAFVNTHAYHKHGTLEIRGHSGTTNAAKIINWILILDTIMSAEVDISTEKVRSLNKLIGYYEFPEFLKEYMLSRKERFSESKEIGETGKSENINDESDEYAPKLPDGIVEKPLGNSINPAINLSAKDRVFTATEFRDYLVARGFDNTARRICITNGNNNRATYVSTHDEHHLIPESVKLHHIRDWIQKIEDMKYVNTFNEYVQALIDIGQPTRAQMLQVHGKSYHFMSRRGGIKIPLDCAASALNEFLNQRVGNEGLITSTVNNQISVTGPAVPPSGPAQRQASYLVLTYTEMLSRFTDASDVFMNLDRALDGRLQGIGDPNAPIMYMTENGDVVPLPADIFERDIQGWRNNVESNINF